MDNLLFNSLYFPQKGLINRQIFFFAAQLYFFITPLLTYYSFSNSNREFLYIVLIGIGITFLCRNLPTISIPLVKNGRSIAITSAFLVVTLISAYLYQFTNYQNFNLNIYKVYEFRDAISQSTVQGYFAYFIGWTTKTALPFLITICIWKKKKISIFILITLSFFIFGATSHKAVIFYPLMIIFFSWILRKTKSLYTVPLVFSLLGLISIIILLYLIDYQCFLLVYLLEEHFFVPSLLTFKYYEFFLKINLYFGVLLF